MLTFFFSNLKGMRFEYFIGIDIAKKSLDVILLKEAKKVWYKRICNDPRELDSLKNELQQVEGFSFQNALFCMEHTGVYSNFILSFLDDHKANAWVVHGMHIKQSMGMVRGKSDKVDACRIASFAFKNQFEAKLWKPERLVITQLKQLVALRERFINNKNALTVHINENGPFMQKNIVAKIKKLSQSSINPLQKAIKKVELDIKALVKTDPVLNELFNIVTSVPGVGQVTASKVIAVTNEFTNITEAKKFACYAGVAPFEHTSGTSIRGKSRVSHKACKPAKHALHMAALTVIRYDNEFGKYYQRKVEEGKPKMSVLNAVRNKIILRIFACVRDQRKYDFSYNT